VRVAVEYPVGPADSTVEEAVLARPSDHPVEAPPLEEVVGAEPMAVVSLEEVVGAEAVVLVAVVPVVLVAVVPVVLLAVVLLANNRYRSQGHGYRRCYRCRDRGRYRHPDRCHRYRGAPPSHPYHPSPSRPSHLHPGRRKMRLSDFGNNVGRLFFF
jgi:hypothetical protein